MGPEQQWQRSNAAFYSGSVASLQASGVARAWVTNSKLITIRLGSAWESDCCSHDPNERHSRTPRVAPDADAARAATDDDEREGALAEEHADVARDAHRRRRHERPRPQGRRRRAAAGDPEPHGVALPGGARAARRRARAHVARRAPDGARPRRGRHPRRQGRLRGRARRRWRWSAAARWASSA